MEAIWLVTISISTVLLIDDEILICIADWDSCCGRVFDNMLAPF
jgi:hypothetical protein